ncbi:type I secretion system permease/ATPase [Fulvimarina sp. 2208YS6-2-32]|uniref:Type I secretion system permease/ATPase n=1 Tax=Fulvimarina uroteuthidis TaxID=3098149 RepID=A0ABU5I0U5_9HYPH|nr:type I secretion system permease/ATPase [Fulvimarina sp. 2208YS6-2-32]MDY8108967.1 type I secretion system permease/ATPase [Fulvimarina sp. 2208YS6-2-32]
MFQKPKQMTVRSAMATCRSAFFAVFLISAILNVLMLTGPIFMLQVYDRVLASNSIPTLLVLAGIAFALYLFSGLLDLLRSKALNRISMRVYTRLSRPTFLANIQMPLLLGAKATAVDPSRDLDLIKRFLSSQGPAAIFDLPFMPLYFLILFLFHPLLGGLALAGGALIFAIVIVNDMMSRAPSRELLLQTSGQSALMSTARRNAEVMHAMGMFENFSARYEERMSDYYAAQERASDRNSSFSSLTKMLRLVLQSAMLGLGAYLAILQEVSPGVMIAASIIMARAIAPIEIAVSQWPSFVAARQAAARLTDTLKRCATEGGTKSLPRPERSLKLEQLATTAPGEPILLLQNVDFELQAGDALGVVGPSGSGKTSLARAVMGVWPLMRGSVRMDGSSIDHWLKAERGTFMGYLPQDIELFEGTIAENISRFSEDPSLTDIIAAAKMSGVHELIAQLPDGYGCKIGEAGARLSAGQRQRIGLARAIYGRPFLIVLDEPNANLDAEGEQALARTIGTLREAGCIVIVIAHRPNVLAVVNKVLVIAHGQQTRFGDRDDVLGVTGFHAPNTDDRRVSHAS